MKINPAKFELSYAELTRRFFYDKDTGKFYRILKRGAPCLIEITGSNNRGYYWVNVKRVVYLVHRLAWFYVTGEHPDFEIDHIDGDRMNNRWDNLAKSDPTLNSRNQGNRKDNTSGVRGVHFYQNVWVARISHKGQRYVLGLFDTIEEATAARKAAEVLFGYHRNHGGRPSWRE
jgi:hypothetical protein